MFQIFQNSPEYLKLEEQTREICEQDPQQNGIREILLDLERKGHATGWDGPDSRPRLFEIATHTDPGKKVEWDWSDGNTYMLQTLCEDHFNGHVGAAMMAVAEHCEDVASYLSTGVVPARWDGMPDEILAQTSKLPGIEQMRHAARNGQDMHLPRKGGRGYRVHGLGLRSEAWMAADASQAAREYADQRRLHEYPDRREMRFIMFVARDGHVWIALRVRGGMPGVIRQPIEDSPYGGLLTQGLCRLLNATIGDTVPVTPLEPTRIRKDTA